jgi:hypothetical protein
MVREHQTRNLEIPGSMLRIALRCAIAHRGMTVNRSNETNLNATKPICAFDANVLKRMPASLLTT